MESDLKSILEDLSDKRLLFEEIEKDFDESQKNSQLQQREW